MARKGLPSKYAKMGFKKGWAAYKRSGRRMSGESMGGSRRKKSHRSRRGVHHAFMLDGDYSTPALVRPPIRKMSGITPSKIISPIIDLGLIIVGMALGATVKKMSPIKNPHLMNGAQTVVSIGGSLLTKNRFVKMPLLGVGLQSTISEAKLLFPKMVPLAGDDEVMYLPVGEDGEAPQLEFMGEDGRIGAVMDGEGNYYVPESVGADRFSGVIDGEDDEDMAGEGRNS